MKKKIKDVKRIKESEKATAPISYGEFKEMMSGLTDDELNLVSDWLLDRQQKP